MAHPELTITVNHPFPSESSTVTKVPSGGTWLAGTYSFLALACYDTSTSTVDSDHFGWIKTIPSEWENVTVVDSSTITITWTTPTDALAAYRYPDHFRVYWQSGSTFALGSQATIAATDIAPYLTTKTMTGPGNLGFHTVPASATVVVMNPVLQIEPVLRQQTVRAYDGRLTNKAYSYFNPLDRIDIRLIGSSMSHADFKKVLKMILYSYPVRAVETWDSDADQDPFIRRYFGRFINSDYLASMLKNTRDVYTVTLEVETGHIT